MFNFAPVYEIAIAEISIDTIWYTINDDAQKYIVTELIGIIVSTLWNGLTNEYVIIKFYVNNNSGRTNYDTGIIIKTGLEISVDKKVPGYNLCILIRVRSLVVILFGIKFKRRIS